MKKDYKIQMSYYDWLTKYHGVERIFFNHNKTKCKISTKNINISIKPYSLKDRAFKQHYNLDILIGRNLIKFSDKRMSDNNLIKALCYEHDYENEKERPDDFYARQSEVFPWNTWMAISFFKYKTKLYDPKKNFSLRQKNNKLIVCHIDALSFIDIITVADTTLGGVHKMKEFSR